MLNTWPRPAGNVVSLSLSLILPKPSSSSLLSSSYLLAAAGFALALLAWRALEAYFTFWTSGALYKSTPSSSTQIVGNCQILRLLSLAQVMRTYLSSNHCICVMADVWACKTNIGFYCLKSQTVTNPSSWPAMISRLGLSRHCRQRTFLRP